MKPIRLASLVAALGLALGGALRAELIHRYDFAANTDDRVGTAHGSLAGGAVLSGGAVVLNGAGAYVNLPPGIISNLTTVTIEAWAAFGSNADWARLFDFGAQNASGLGRNYVFFTPHAGGGVTRMAISDADPGYNNERQVTAAGVLDNQGLNHVVCVFDPVNSRGTLYLDGAEAAVNSAFDIPLASVHNALSWLGRSLYNGDAYLNGQISEFRIYNHALSAVEVTANFINGPDTVGGGPVTLILEPASQTVVEGSPVTFQSLAIGTAPITYLWYRDDSPLPAGTNRTYTLPVTTLADDGALFFVDASNSYSNVTHVATSSNALLRVLSDTSPPLLLETITLSSYRLRLRFNERVNPDTAMDPAHYQLTHAGGSIPITAATLDATGSNVVLQTGLLELGPLYTLAVIGVRDASSNANLIAPGAALSFVADFRFILGDARLEHRYSFERDATDSAGSAHGELRGNAYLAENALVLDGAGSYLNLPNNLVTGLTSITLEAWLVEQGSGAWARIFDFGNSSAGEDFPVGTGSSGTQYLFLTPVSGSGTLRGAGTAGAGEQLVEWSGTPLPANTLKHIVWTCDAIQQTAALYVDGVEVARNAAFTLTPAALGPTVNNWIGRSQFSADPFLRATLSEIRIYEGSIGAEEVTASFQYGPDRLPSTGPAVILQQPASVTVVEQRPAAFTVAVGGFPVPQVQWLRNGSAIPGATHLTYTLPAVPLDDDQVVFTAVVSNIVNGTLRSVTSSNAVLTVLADHEPPLLLTARATSTSIVGALNGVFVQFSERLSPATATDTANYQLAGPAGPVGITATTLASDGAGVMLTTEPLLPGAGYSLTLSGIRDAAVAGNLIAPGTQVTFTATAFTLTNLGAPGTGVALVPVPGGYNLSGSGAGPASNQDQLGFAHQVRAGDFDVSVRLAVLQLSDNWAQAGLMARSSLVSNAPFAATLATPGAAGCFFAARPQLNASTATTGSFPVNYPFTWLRLRRTGDQFAGFGSLDGETWEFLGDRQVPMPTTVHLGLMISSGSAAATTRADFRDLGIGGGVVVTNSPLPFEPPGPSTRRTALVITELMYHPPGAWGGTNNLEFVELWNSGLVTEDLTGHRLAGDVDYTFPAATQLPPGAFLVVARDPAAAAAFYGTDCLGPYTGALPNNGGTLRLVNELGGRLLEIDYDDQPPWPVAADGAGHSLVLSRPSYGENNPRAWNVSNQVGGSPGQIDAWSSEPARSVVINEFLANTDAPLLDYVELFNRSILPVDLSGAWLSDDPDAVKFRFPTPTVLPGRSHLVLDENQLGFALSASGEQIFLVNSNQTRVLDAVAFDSQPNALPTGRYPDGADDLQMLAERTPAAPNAPPHRWPVVFNEIMYHPIAGGNDAEYLELCNRGVDPVTLADWRIDGGVRFTFPPEARIAPGAYVVVAANLTNLLARYPQLNAANAFGNFSGALGNAGERLTLLMPEYSFTTNSQGLVTTNVLHLAVNDIHYRDGGRWGQWSDGGGSSLELVDPEADNRFAASWADSNETGKAPWTLIEATHILENGQTASMINQGGYHGPPTRFEFFLHDPGEVLVDDLEFRNNGGPNLVANGDFAGGAAGYTLQGTLRGSFVEPGAGADGSPALRVVATDRGDTGPNKIATPFTATVLTNPPNTGTIRAKVRWLKGSPHILFRTRGHWMEVSQRLDLPANCGTPGLPNSRQTANAGPVIIDVTHTPILPAPGQPVVVTARVLDPDGVGAVLLNYRLDPAPAYLPVPMTDDGTGADATAGDGVYSGTIPGQADRQLAAFYIAAADARLDVPGNAQFPAHAPTRECLVRWGEPAFAGTLGVYRLWLTESNIAFWTSRERNANDPIDATFVYGNSRVIYNVNALYSGSPFHSPIYTGPLGANPPDFEINFQPDDRFLGTEPFVLTAFDVPNGNFFFTDKTTQVDLTGNWIARQLGQPYNYRRHIHCLLNGQRRGTIYDDVQQPNRDVLDQYFPNDEQGELRKIEDWFEFADDAETQGITTATLQRFDTSAGQIDTKRYRWTWRPRATDDPDRWYALTNLILAVSDTAHPDYLNRLRGWLDVPNVLRPIVAHHICGDWDSYGYERGKNMYAYKPDDLPWRFLMWDVELALGAGSRAPTDSIYNIHDPVLAALISSQPAVHREYLGAYLEALYTSLAPGAADALLDERYASLLQNGVAVASPQSIKNYIAERRAYLLTVIPSAPFALNETNSLTVTSNLLNLTGTAPLNAHTFLVNQLPHPPTWTSVTNWSLQLALRPGFNELTLTARDRFNADLGSTTLTVNYTGTLPDPADYLALNEIMFNPLIPQTAFVEFGNRHPTAAFDLSGWRVNGLGYRFPGGSVLPPGQFIVLGKSRSEFFKLYRTHPAQFDEFPGALQNNGETLTLLRPGESAGTEIEVDKVKYEARRPWPAAAAQDGSSLQLADAAQDNARVSNWAVDSGWRFFSTNGIPGGTRITMLVYPDAAGTLVIDDLKLVAGTVPELGSNYIVNGDFEAPFGEPWRVRGTAGTNTTNTAVHAKSGDFGLQIHFTAPGSGANYLYQDVLGVDTLAPHTLSFYYRPSASIATLTVRLSSAFRPAPEVGVPPGGLIPASPGEPNSTLAAFPAYPLVWLNEVLPLNLSGYPDNQGTREPWIELYNSGPEPIALNGFSLSDDYQDLGRWTFPANAALQPGEFKIVIADAQPEQTTADEWHANFRLTAGTGSVALSRPLEDAWQILDYLNYDALAADQSYGAFPDGQLFHRQIFFLPTPGTTNTLARPPVPVRINEWMAANSGFILDPADLDADDWFELHNPGSLEADLEGYTLTDNLANPAKFRIPSGYVIPPGGFLLVWADEETAQNHSSRIDLHVNFKLSQNGESIGLFAPDGSPIDTLDFGPQTNNVSEGRYPDGAGPRYFMPTPTPRLPNQVPAVSEPPDITGIVLLPGGFVQFSFATQPAARYQVEYKNDLNDPDWLPLGEAHDGTGSTLTVTDDTQAAAQRFYRVSRL